MKENNQPSKLEKLKKEIDNLSIEEQIDLIQHTLKNSNLSVTFGASQSVKADVVFYFQSQPIEQLGPIFEALAKRFSSPQRDTD
ncbi:MAG: hypothetical protein QNJ54_29320 [Prochloraceae cyanobacterium]|nr:hypothetical protein [Prochloraceae cyanobacterium]